MTAASDSDLVLLSRYAKLRDADSFLEITNRHAAMVFAVARRVTGNVQDAEDVSQACFLELARRAQDIRTCVGGWLHKVAVRRSQNVRREAAVRQRNERMKQHPSAVSAEAEWDEIAPILHDALGGLADDLRLPLVLLYLEGRTQQEVAIELGVSQATISRRAREGIQQLRSTLGRMGIHTTAAAIIGGVAADARATVPTSLRESLGNLALSGIGPSSPPANAGWGMSPIWVWLVAVSALVALRLLLVYAEPMMRRDSIVQHPDSLRMPIDGDRDTQSRLIGALRDSARLAGREVDYAELLGDSSLAFIARWYRLDVQPPVDRDAPWDSVGYLVYAGNRELGLLERSLGMSLQSHSSPADADATGLMASIVAAIRAGESPVGYLVSARPQVDEGCCPAHVVLIVGADPVRKRLLLRRDDRERPTWHAAADLAPRLLIPRKNREPLARRDALLAALRAAVASWDSPPDHADEEEAMCVHRDVQRYSGWRAYDAWTEDVRENVPDTSERSQQLRAISQWCFGLLLRGRCQAAIYLRREARQFTGQPQHRLINAADLYARFAEGAWSGALGGQLDKRPDGAKETVRMLRLARQLDAMAIRELQTFLNSVPDPLASLATSDRTTQLPDSGKDRRASYPRHPERSGAE